MYSYLKYMTIIGIEIMTSLLHFYRTFFTQKKSILAADSQLIGYDSSNKQEALDAVDVLVDYKTSVHEFTDEIVAFWSLPKKVMERYSLDDAEQLNDWLDGFSH